MRNIMDLFNKPLEMGLIPDALIRFYVRRLCRIRVSSEPVSVTEKQDGLTRFIESLSGQPIAVDAQLPNVQHYEVPSDFFRMVLGKHLKYSCCHFGEEGVLRKPHLKLDEAEERMLKLTCQRAELGDGQKILELGCGWGSLSLFMAERYPLSQVTAVSNSKTQKACIDGEIKKRGILNLQIITADMNSFSINADFDRVVSVEMFEHMRNYGDLMKKVAGFLKPDGKLFVHIFTYGGTPYVYDFNDPADWMAQHFFAGGMMPGSDLLLFFTNDLVIEKRWTINGRHYQNTLEAWLRKMDQQGQDILPFFRNTYGQKALKFRAYWRIFFLACAEVFGYEDGNRWFVSHYLFRKI